MAERLAKLDITWYEEPAGPESSQTLRAMRERIPSDVTICVGERHYTRFGIRSLLEKHVCDIIMPDITRCGGPSEMKRMATMAEAYNVLIAPHNPNGPLSTLASSHVCAAIPNFSGRNLCLMMWLGGIQLLIIPFRKWCMTGICICLTDPVWE